MYGQRGWANDSKNGCLLYFEQIQVGVSQGRQTEGRGGPICISPQAENDTPASNCMACLHFNLA